MKLYSRGQLVLFALISGLSAALFTFGMVSLSGLLSKKTSEAAGEVSGGVGAHDGENAAQAVQAGTPLSGTPLAETPFQLIADSPSWLDAPVTSVQASNTYNVDERENIALYEKLNAGVVNITTETMAYNWFLEPTPREGVSGSGSIIDNRGYIITNNHVIKNAFRVNINLSDGSQYEGTVVGTDPDTDIAVLKFEPPKGSNLQVIPYGDSSELKVGQKVLAIGNPFGYERTLTVGIVSGLGRPIEITRNHIVRDMIQTDASINPGNSGGPLLDTKGRMIGINTMIASPSGVSAGVGFAVPVNIAKQVAKELLQYGKVRRGDIDASLVPLFPQLVRYAKLTVNSGMLVSRTVQNGLAEKAGLKQGSERVQSGRSFFYLGGDIIVSIGGIKTGSWSEYYSALDNNKPGDKVKLEIIRDGKQMTLDVTLADREEMNN